MSTITLRASARYGYGGKQYIARITGRHPKFQLDRQFVGRKGGKRNEDSEHETDEPGLYERRDVDRKGSREDRYVLVIDRGEDDLVAVCADKSDALKIARALDGGRPFESVVQYAEDEDGDPSYQILTAAQAKRAAAVATIEDAVEGCWQVLQALPEKEAKKVLTTLRKRLVNPGLYGSAPSDTTGGAS